MFRGKSLRSSIQLLAVLSLFLPAAATAGPPVVVRVSTPVNPNETALLVGEGFDENCEINVGRLADAPCSEPTRKPASLPADARDCKAIQPSLQSVKFVIPPDFAPGVFVCRISNGNGQTTLLLNAPEAWWVQGDGGTTASPGGWLSVQGKCLAMSGGETTVLLVGPATVRLPASGNGYSLRAALPADLPPGNYEMRVHNGCGGDAAWSGPLALEVAPPRKWPALTVNVRELGAEGDGSADDTAAIKAGLEQLAANGGGVLYFPRGRYLVTETLTIPEHAVLRGERRELCLLAWPERDEPLPDILVATHSFALEELTFGLSNYGNFLATTLQQPESGNVRLRRIRVLGNRYRGHIHQKPEVMAERFTRFGVHGGKLLSLGGCNVEITDSDFLSSGCCLYLTRARGARITNSRFRMGRFGWFWLSGSDGVIMEDNELLGADLSTWGGGINTLDGSNCSQNVYFARNRLAFFYGGDHEAVTTDGSGAAYFGRIESVSGTSLTVADDPEWGKRDWRGCGVFIMGGRGMCQERTVVEYDGRRLTLDRPWEIEPDDTSWVSVTRRQGRLLLVGNSFEEVGVAIQFFGSSTDCVADGNTVCRGLGFINHGMNYHGNQPSWFVQWLGNEIAEGNSYGNAYFSNKPSAIDVTARPRGDTPGFFTVGTIVRGNRLLSNAAISVGAGNPPSPAARNRWLRDVIVEHNEVRDNEVGIAVADEVAGAWVRDNHFSGVEEEVMDIAQLRARSRALAASLAGSAEPIARWSFDAVKGARVPDLSGHGLDLVVTGDLGLEPEGIHGAAARFDGQTHLTAGSPARPVQDILHQPAFTLAVWVKPDTVGGRRPLIGKRFAQTNVPFILSINDGTIVYEGSDVDLRYSYNFASPRVVEPGEWQHLAAVIESGKSVTLYRNGRKIAEKTVTRPLGENLEPLVFGRDGWGGPQKDAKEPAFYEGLMDEAKFWARALTPDQVKADADRQAVP